MTRINEDGGKEANYSQLKTEGNQRGWLLLVLTHWLFYLIKKQIHCECDIESSFEEEIWAPEGPLACKGGILCKSSFSVQVFASLLSVSLHHKGQFQKNKLCLMSCRSHKTRSKYSGLHDMRITVWCHRAASLLLRPQLPDQGSSIFWLSLLQYLTAFTWSHHLPTLLHDRGGVVEKLTWCLWVQLWLTLQQGSHGWFAKTTSCPLVTGLTWFWPK